MNSLMPVSESRVVADMLDVQGLQVHYPVHAGLVRRRQVGAIKAVDGVSFSIGAGKTLGLVGESGCGKSTVGRAILGLIASTGGAVTLNDIRITGLSEKALRPLRREMQMIFQDPFASLNSRMTVGQILREPIAVHRLREGRAAIDERVSELISLVGLDPKVASRYPHEFSGGQRQRIGIARALAVEPKFLVCDEPVSALDVSIQAQVINLLEELQDRLGLTYLFIAHGLAVIKHISDDVAVMYLGKIVEVADTRKLYAAPRHPYTLSLLSAAPIANPAIEKTRRRILLTGDPPSPLNPPSGCRFHTRCPIAVAQCSQFEPPLADVGDGQRVACWRADESRALMLQ